MAETQYTRAEIEQMEQEAKRLTQITKQYREAERAAIDEKVRQANQKILEIADEVAEKQEIRYRADQAAADANKTPGVFARLANGFKQFSFFDSQKKSVPVTTLPDTALAPFKTRITSEMIQKVVTEFSKTTIEVKFGAQPIPCYMPYMGHIKLHIAEQIMDDFEQHMSPETCPCFDRVEFSLVKTFRTDWGAQKQLVFEPIFLKPCPHSTDKGANNAKKCHAALCSGKCSNPLMRRTIGAALYPTKYIMEQQQNTK